MNMRGITIGRILHASLRRMPAARKLVPTRIRWTALSQAKELNYHQHCDWRPTPAFDEQNAYLFPFFGYPEESVAGKTIVDLGAGSKLRTRFFKNASIIAIEPLADEYLSSIEWCDLRRAVRVYSEPAERKIKEIAGVADLVVSINVLDHCYDAQKVLDNCFSYLKPGGELCMSVDLHDRYDPFHPIDLTRDKLIHACVKSGFEIVRTIEGLGNVGRSYDRQEDLAVTVIAKRPALRTGASRTTANRVPV